MVTPIHIQGDSEDTHSAILEIAGSDAPNPTDPTTTLMNWHVATDTTNPACKAPWRLPTRAESKDIQENMIMWEIDALTGTFYWTASKVKDSGEICGFTSENVDVSKDPSSTDGSVRCVRNL